VEGEARERLLRRRFTFLERPCLVDFLRLSFSSGRLPARGLLDAGRGPALPARLPLGVPALGVPGPSEDCLPRFDGRAGMLRVPSGRGRFRSELVEVSRCDRFICRAAALCTFDRCDRLSSGCGGMPFMVPVLLPAPDIARVTWLITA
jgi:hypothetical protein